MLSAENGFRHVRFFNARQPLIEVLVLHAQAFVINPQWDNGSCLSCALITECLVHWTARKIREAEAGYVLQVKANQSTLNDKLQQLFFDYGDND